MPMAAAMSAIAVSQLAAGYAQSKQSKYNAKLYEQQADAIEVQKVFQDNAYNRKLRQLKGSYIARAGAFGLGMSGSVANALIDSVTQLEIDRQVGRYNFDLKKNYALAAAETYKREARQVMIQSSLNAFSTMMMAGTDYGMRSGLFSRPAGSEMIGSQWGVRMSGGVRYRGV